MDRFLPEVVSDIASRAIEHVYSYAPLAEKSVILVPSFVSAQVSTLSEAIGFDEETLSYTLGMFLCYPLGLIMAMLPFGKIRHVFSFLLGAFLLQFTIGKQWIHILISSLACYFMFLLLPAKTCKTVVPVFLMTYCTAGHLHRQFVNYLGWDLDFTGSQMVLTVKLYALAFNLFDGEQIAKGKEDRAAKKCASVAVERLPGIIEFLGYCFSFSTILAGPAYEYKIYADACDGSKLFDKDGKPLGKTSNVLPTLKPFFVSLVCMGLFVVGGGMFPFFDPTDRQNNLPFILTEEFLAKPWIHRYGYMWLSLFFLRQKYYFAWKNAEGASNIWYAGFEGFDKDGKELGWNEANNVDILGFETGINVKSLTGAWNKKTANWLGRYVYMRTGGSLLATYSLSAFWHGFYPGYYFFFLSVPAFTIVDRLAEKKIWSRFQGGKWSPVGICRILITSFLIMYFIAPFQLLAFDWGLAAWKSHYFFGHILVAVFYVVLSNIPSPKKKTA